MSKNTRTKTQKQASNDARVDSLMQQYADEQQLDADALADVCASLKVQVADVRALLLSNDTLTYDAALQQAVVDAAAADKAADAAAAADADAADVAADTVADARNNVDSEQVREYSLLLSAADDVDALAAAASKLSVSDVKLDAAAAVDVRAALLLLLEDTAADNTYFSTVVRSVRAVDADAADAAVLYADALAAAVDTRALVAAADIAQQATLVSDDKAAVDDAAAAARKVYVDAVRAADAADADTVALCNALLLSVSAVQHADAVAATIASVQHIVDADADAVAAAHAADVKKARMRKLVLLASFKSENAAELSDVSRVVERAAFQLQHDSAARSQRILADALANVNDYQKSIVDAAAAVNVSFAAAHKVADAAESKRTTVSSSARMTLTVELQHDSAKQLTAISMRKHNSNVSYAATCAANATDNSYSLSKRVMINLQQAHAAYVDSLTAIQRNDLQNAVKSKLEKLNIQKKAS